MQVTHHRDESRIKQNRSSVRRQAVKQVQIQRPQPKPAPLPIDLRTPSGKRLPF
jgi:hypothetical protein